MRPENRIDYIEIPVADLQKARAFFEGAMAVSTEGFGSRRNRHRQVECY
jgi:catechol 2,3-dioxygenase-like lactoylglutathione lyase family enzyme